MRIPLWLDAAWTGDDASRPAGGALADIVWGQYALFLSFRVKDDVLDRRGRDLRRLFVADLFLLESLRSFRRVAELDDRFWQFYLDCVRGTIEGAAEVGRLEAEPGGFRAEHLELHARVAGMAKVGVAAVCRLHRHEQDAEWLSRLQDRLAIADQIEDDLKDLKDDLRAGRYTWVGNELLALRPGDRPSWRECAGRLGEGLLRAERGAAITDALRRTLAAASDALPASAPPPLFDLVRRLSTAPDEIEESMHKTRVWWVLAQGLETPSPPKRPTNRPRSTSIA